MITTFLVELLSHLACITLDASSDGRADGSQTTKTGLLRMGDKLVDIPPGSEPTLDSGKTRA